MKQAIPQCQAPAAKKMSQNEQFVLTHFPFNGTPVITKWDTYYESPHRPEGDSIQGCTHASGTFIYGGSLKCMRV